MDRHALYLNQRRTVLINGTIDNRNHVDQICEDIAYLDSIGREAITIKINSPGGYVDLGLNIYDALVHCESPTIGVVERYARSIAAFILQACTERHMWEHAHLLLHGTDNPLLGRRVTETTLRDARFIEETADAMREANAHLYSILTRRSTVTKRDWKSYQERDTRLSARESLRLGLIDRIV